ncbi:hypothetical protein [Peribacillus sp. FSL E2-0159]|uniref:hypothetical protein n=1 Tax=Peribacillus sp. FSL E2-0159 TaxID=2975289 RepID=UPI00315A8388
MTRGDMKPATYAPILITLIAEPITFLDMILCGKAKATVKAKLLKTIQRFKYTIAATKEVDVNIKYRNIPDISMPNAAGRNLRKHVYFPHISTVTPLFPPSPLTGDIINPSHIFG